MAIANSDHRRREVELDPIHQEIAAVLLARPIGKNGRSEIAIFLRVSTKD